MAPRWRYVGQLGAQDGQLRTILGGILGHISDLERDLRSVKTTNTTTLFVVFRGSGARLEGPLGSILDVLVLTQSSGRLTSWLHYIRKACPNYFQIIVKFSWLTFLANQ